METDVVNSPDAKRILFVHANNQDIGGADLCLLRMAQEIRDRGWDPVVVLRENSAISEAYAAAGIHVEYVAITRMQRQLLRNPLALGIGWIRSVAALVQLFRKVKPALVHANDLLDIHAPIAARLCGVPCVQHVRMILPRGVLRTASVGLALAVNREVLCVSDAVRREMFDNAPRAVTLYDWVAPYPGMSPGEPVRVELGIDDATPIVLCVGRLEEWKGQHVLVEALPLIQSTFPGALFVFVGDAVPGKESYSEALRARVRALGASTSVRFLGFRTDVPRLMGAAAVVVHTSTQPDPFPGVVLEAIQSNTIVVGARAGGVPEEVHGLFDDLLFSPGDSDDLAHRVVRALSDPSFSARAKNGRHHIESRFGVERMAPLLTATYTRLIGN